MEVAMRGDKKQIELRDIKGVTLDKAGDASRCWTVLSHLCYEFNLNALDSTEEFKR